MATARASRGDASAVSGPTPPGCNAGSRSEGASRTIQILIPDASVRLKWYVPEANSEVVHATDGLLEEAIRRGVRYRRPDYDSLDLVLANALGGRVVTADGRLYRGAQEGRRRVDPGAGDSGPAGPPADGELGMGSAQEGGDLVRHDRIVGR